MKRNQKILEVFNKSNKNELSSFELHKLSGMNLNTFYTTLFEMEMNNQLDSKWIDGPSPRIRVYFLIYKDG